MLKKLALTIYGDHFAQFDLLDMLVWDAFVYIDLCIRGMKDTRGESLLP